MGEVLVLSSALSETKCSSIPIHYVKGKHEGNNVGMLTRAFQLMVSIALVCPLAEHESVHTATATCNLLLTPLLFPHTEGKL